MNFGKAKHVPWSTKKKLTAGYFALLVLALTVIGIFSLLGYKLIEANITYVLFVLLSCSLLGLGDVLILRRLERKWARMLTVALGVVIVVGVALVQLSFFSFMSIYSTPHMFTTLTAPEGKKFVIMCSYNLDADLINERAAARRANDPQAEEDSVSFEDVGVLYETYPKFALFFYNTNVQPEGSVEIGSSSAAKLMYEWPDAHTLHLYIENPEAYDAGELTLTF